MDTSANKTHVPESSVSKGSVVPSGFDAMSQNYSETTMYMLNNATEASGAETPEHGLSSMNIYFTIVGVLFVLVIIMLGRHHYIKKKTHGGTKKLPTFGVNSVDRSKARMVLRPVISINSHK